MTNIRIQSLLQKGWGEGTEIKKNAQDLNVVDKATKTSWEGEPTRQTKRGPSQGLVRLNDQLHRSQLRDKIIKNKGNNMGRVEDMGVIDWRLGKKQKGNMPEEQHKAQKWTNVKKGPTRGSPWRMPTNGRMIDKSLERKWWLHNKRS